MSIMDKRMVKFLKLIPVTGWREVPVIWNEQLRQALNDSLVTIGWGGVLKLTDQGRAAASDGQVAQKK